MKCLITGGCGFLGTAPIRARVKEGRHVVRADNLAVGICDGLRYVSSGVEHITLPGAVAESV